MSLMDHCIHYSTPPGKLSLVDEHLDLGIISKLNDAKKTKLFRLEGEGVGIDIISISSFIIFLASQ